MSERKSRLIKGGAVELDYVNSKSSTGVKSSCDPEKESSDWVCGGVEDDTKGRVGRPAASRNVPSITRSSG